MNLELQGSVVSAPVLTLSSENLYMAPQMEIEAFVVLPSSVRELVFRLGVVRLVAIANTALSSSIGVVFHHSADGFRPHSHYYFPSLLWLGLAFFWKQPFTVFIVEYFCGSWQTHLFSVEISR